MHEHEHHISKPLLWALGLTVTIMAVEFFGGLVSNSLALISDSAHMLTDAMALLMAFFAFYISRKISADKERTFGYYRLEILSALINGVILMLIAIGIFYGAYARISDPPEINSGVMLVVAVIGLIANLISIFVLRPHSHGNLNIKGAFWHIVSDTLSSVGVIIGGLVVALTGFRLIDPILSILIGCLIVRGAWGILSEVVAILMEGAPSDIDMGMVIKDIKGIEGIKNVHHVHLWTITSGYHALSAHVEIEDRMVSQCTGLIDKINSMLHDKFEIEHATLQLECENCGGGLVCERHH